MSKIFPLSLFPEQFFPDVTLKDVRLTESTLEITVTDGQWALEDKMVLFYGPGVMTFTYSGQLQGRWRASSDADWEYVTSPDIFKHVAFFDMIVSGDKYWAFRFRPEQKEYTMEVLLGKVTHIAWSGAGEDLEEDEE